MAEKRGPEAIAVIAAWILIAACLLLTLRTGEVSKTDERPKASITEITQNYGSEDLTVDIRQPVISGLGDKVFEAGLNLMIERQISEALSYAEQAADEFWREAEREGFEPWQYVFYAEYAVKSIEGVLSLTVTTLMYTGGPGMPETVCYNADIASCRLITLSDLFKNDGYKEAINAVIESGMAKDPERYLGDEPFRGVTDKTKFFIYEGKLYITFAKYEVASGAAGEPEFLIPTDEIRRFLKPEYKAVITKD